jgi:hypothetical protein
MDPEMDGDEAAIMRGRETTTAKMRRSCNMTDQEDRIGRTQGEIREGTLLQNAHPHAARRKSRWNLLLPAFLLPLWFAMGYAGIELAWALHVAWHPDDGGHGLAYWRHSMDGPRFLMLIPPMMGALPLAMIAANFLVYRIGPARRAMAREGGDSAAAHYTASQRALFRFALAVTSASAGAAMLGAWLN